MKAEDSALEHCCAKCENNKLNCGMKLLSHGRDCIKCGNYIKGYEQAEKDLELTWKDIKMIYRLVDVVADDLGIKAINTNIYEEVLKRYKETNKKNNNYGK